MTGALVSTATAQQKDTKANPYPLEKCIVSDEKLGEMGKPVVLVYECQEMKFCCEDLRDRQCCSCSNAGVQNHKYRSGV